MTQKNPMKEELKKKLQKHKVYLKIHTSEWLTIYAFSDPELIGKKLKSEKLSFYVNPNFYAKGAELIPLTQALNLLRGNINSNIIGRLAYYTAQVGLVNKHAILWIHDTEKKIKVPHLITMKIQ